MPRRLIQSFSPGRLPPMTRHSYRRELVTSMTMPVAMALVEGGVVGVLARKVFDVSALQLAAITAAPMFANVTSFLWARLSRGRRKIPCITAVMGAALVSIGSIALLPVNAAGAWLLTGLVVLSRCLQAGVVTIRSTVWRHNYPRHLRGQITAKLATLVSLLLLLTPLTGSIVLDLEPHSFRLLYALGAATALIGVWQYSKVRLRGERALLRFERSPAARPSRHGGAGGLYEYDDRRSARPGLWDVLRRDPLFRRYMLWQFIGGVANQTLEPVVIYFVTERTEGMQAAFLLSIALAQGIPAMMTIATLAVWARMLDRVHVARFRFAQSWLWIISQLLMWAAAVWSGSAVVALAVLAAGRLMLGVARGGGVLAWNLGHNDFASREMVAAYMGVHVTLTGVRGAFAPFLGMALYTGWGAVSLGPLSIPAFAGIGGHVFALSAALSTVAMVGFYTLSRRVRRLDPGAPGLTAGEG